MKRKSVYDQSIFTIIHSKLAVINNPTPRIKLWGPLKQGLGSSNQRHICPTPNPSQLSLCPAIGINMKLRSMYIFGVFLSPKVSERKSFGKGQNEPVLPKISAGCVQQGLSPWELLICWSYCLLLFQEKCRGDFICITSQGDPNRLICLQMQNLVVEAGCEPIYSSPQDLIQNQI